MNPPLTLPATSVSDLEDVKLGRSFRFEKECRLLGPPDPVVGDDPNKNLSAKVTGEIALPPPPPPWDSVLRLMIDDPEIRLEVSENSEWRFGLVESLSLGKGTIDGLSGRGIGGGFRLADSFRKMLKFLLDFKDLEESEVVVGKCIE